MAFTQNTFSPVASQASDTPALYLYKTDDSIATVTASGYFYEKRYQLEVGDVIFMISGGIVSVIDVLTLDPVTTKRTIPTLDADGNLGLGTDTPICNIHILDDAGLACIRVESTDDDAGIMQLQLINDISKEMSIGKLGSNVNFFGVGSGAILNRDGNMNIICDSDDDIIFYCDPTDSQALNAVEHVRIESGGTIKLGAPAVVWDDLKEAAIARSLDTSSGRIDYNYAEATIDYATNARYNVSEQLTFAMQMSHAYKHGTNLRPHVHWIQNQDAVPNWLIEYRVVSNGGAVPATFTQAICSSQVFTYTTGNIMQICKFPEITGVSETSFSVDVKLFRDVDNDTGLFTGVDLYTGIASIKFFDIHYQIDTLGSRQEYIK